MKVAMAQINIVWENKESNKRKCIEFVNQASEQKVDLILFPEMCLTGFSMNIDRVCDKENHDRDWFTKLSQEKGLSIGFGSVEMVDGMPRNFYTVVSGDDGVILRYSKIHSFSYASEDKFFTSGDSVVFSEINHLPFSAFICYDLRFPEIFQIASSKAHLIVVAANWPSSRREHWNALLQARAIENQCYIAAVNRFGEGDGLFYSGDSQLIDPLGNVVAGMASEEGLLIGNVESSLVLELRSRFGLKNDRKEALYAKFLEEKIKGIIFS